MNKKTPKLRLRPRKFTGATTVISIRIPKDMVHALDEKAKESRRSRNEFISLGLEFALEHVEITDE